jgi:L-fucose mutarotase
MWQSKEQAKRLKVTTLQRVVRLRLLRLPSVSPLIVSKSGPQTECHSMLRHKLIHPQISAILAAAGHHSTVLIADGNYPAASKRGPRAELISLNLMPGVPTCNQVLDAILSAVPVEAIQTMETETSGPYALDGDPPVWDDYRETIKQAGLDLQLQPVDKWKFYEAVSTPDHVLTIQTADQQRYANILLTIGVRMD